MPAPTDPEKVRELLLALDGFKGSMAVQTALNLAPLVFVRPGELRAARWEEFNFDEGLWRIPQKRMKMRLDHIVPLSRQAIRLLEDIKPLTGHGEYVFPGGRDPKKCMSEAAVNSALRRMGDGRFGHFDFRKHFYGRMGDFDSKEEFECACKLDMWAQQGRIQFWVRNLVRREGCSFFLQKADGRFYPDFLCQLPGSADKPGVILAVEYKGADRWNGAEDDRLIGGLWANLSEGRCRFVMVKDKRWDWIEEKLK